MGPCEGVPDALRALAPCLPHPAPDCKTKTSKRKKPPSPPERAPPTLSTFGPSDRIGVLLREAAGRADRCAPTVGARVRAHLEIRVSPEGKVLEVRAVHAGGALPPGVAACLRAHFGALRLPGFDGAEPVRFSLSVVL